MDFPHRKAAPLPAGKSERRKRLRRSCDAAEGREDSKPVSNGGFTHISKTAPQPDLLEGVLLHRVGSLPLPQALGLNALDRLAASGGDLDHIVAQRSPWLVNCVDKDLRLALGLDQPSTVEKFRAIVARAYLRSWRYADKVAATREAMRRAPRRADTLREALGYIIFGRSFSQPGGGWTGPDDFAAINWERERLGEIVNDLHILRCERQSERAERRQSITEALEALVHLQQSLTYFSIPRWRPVIEDQFFFEVCLGEAFTALTGLKPIFDHVRRKRSEGQDWRKFLDAAFILCGLESDLPKKAQAGGAHEAEKGMPSDLLTEKLRLGPPREGEYHPVWFGYFERLADDFSKPVPMREPHMHARLNSNGLDLDYDGRAGIRRIAE